MNFSIFLMSGMMSVLYWMHCKESSVNKAGIRDIHGGYDIIAPSRLCGHLTFTLSVSLSTSSPLWCVYFMENLASGLLWYIPSAADSKSSQFFTNTIIVNDNKKCVSAKWNRVV